MEKCPVCGIYELKRLVRLDEPLPRFSACPSCSYPLDFKKLWNRVEAGPVTDAARGSLYGPELVALSYDEAFRRLKQNRQYRVDALAEYESALVFRLMDQGYIFNFGSAGDCMRYWGT